MPYPRIVDANVYTAVAGNTILDADINELQAQLTAILGPQSWNIPMVGGIPDSGWAAASTYWDYLEEPGTDPPYWQCQGAAAMKYLNIPIPFARKNFKMTRLFCVVSGDSAFGDDFDGWIKFTKNTISAAGAAVSSTTISAQPWRTASAWTLIDSGALAITFDGIQDCRLVVASAGDATNRTCRLLGAYATIQLGV